MTENEVWAVRFENLEVVCTRELTSFSDLVNDSSAIQAAVDSGGAEVVRLVAEVRSKVGEVYGRSTKDALELLEHREPFDIYRLERSFVKDVALSAIGRAVEHLEPSGGALVSEAKELQESVRGLVMI